ncbi:MAG: NAD(+)/NADH kinase [Lachnospirales bacterium]
MKKVGILINSEKDVNFIFTKKVCSHIERDGVEIFVEDCVNTKKYTRMTISEIFEKCDYAIVIGGDGTILNKIKHSNFYNAQIYGINIGNLGYLTDVDKNKYKSGIDKLLSGDTFTEKRMMLECNYKNHKVIALNDVCIAKGHKHNMVITDIEINNSHVDTVRGDGLIVATPTGSTAYNLSAGGPILKSDCEVIGVTPISPHAIFARPFVVSGDDEICITVSDTGSDATLFVDGKNLFYLNDEEKIYIKKSTKNVIIVKTTEKNFYKVLRDKIQR